jgi:hypothetical protein
MSYKPAGTTVTVLDNPRIINLGEATRIPAIVALGPVTRVVVDEAVQRGQGATDNLSMYPGSGLSVGQITNTTGVTAGQLTYVQISANGALYSSPASASIGTLTWPQGVLGPNFPATGSVYYVSYQYTVPSTQYDPYTASDKNLIKARYGAESNSTGLLTIGGSIVLENGSPAVMLVQASGSAYIEANYKTAIDKLQKKDNIEQLVILFPSGSVTRAQQETLLTYAMSHVLTMSNNGKERGLMCGSPSATFVADGFDTIGDNSTVGTYVYRANALNNRNVVYVVPSYCTRPDANGNTMVLDGNYAAAAVAGVQAAQSNRSTPIGGFVVTGITLLDEKWNDFEMNQLGAADCLVLDSHSGVATIRDAITTDGTSADTQEISVVAVQRLVKRTVRTGLNNTYVGKGVVITNTTTSHIEGTTAAILQTLTTAGEIAGYGTVDNPTTGEVKISAKQNAQEPRQVDVTFSYRPAYPLKFLQVTVSVFVG